MDVFDRVEFLLAQRGWKRTELMRHIGQERALYDVWKKAEKIPDDQYAAIAQALDTTIAYLQGETDMPGIPGQQGRDAVLAMDAAQQAPGGMQPAGMEPPGPISEKMQQLQRIYAGLQGMDAKGLNLIEGMIALYRAQQS